MVALDEIFRASTMSATLSIALAVYDTVWLMGFTDIVSERHGRHERDSLSSSRESVDKWRAWEDSGVGSGLRPREGGGDKETAG